MTPVSPVTCLGFHCFLLQPTPCCEEKWAGLLWCRWCADCTTVKTPVTDMASHKGKICNKYLSCIWDLAIQKGMPLTCTGESKQITVVSSNINRKLMKTYIQHSHKMKSCSGKWPSTSIDIALNSWILVAMSTKINRGACLIAWGLSK